MKPHKLFNARYPVIIAAAMLAGTAVGARLQGWTATAVCAALLALVFVYATLVKAGCGGTAVFGTVLIVFLFYSGTKIQSVRALVLPDSEALYYGTVVSTNTQEDGRVLRVRTAYGTVRLTVSGGQVLKSGDEITFRARLKKYDEGANIYSYDGLRGGLAAGNTAGAYIGLSDVSVLSARNTFLGFFESVRDTVRGRLYASMPDAQARTVSAMLLGTDADDQTERMLSDIGIVHILSVSGLHISFIAYTLLWLLKRMQASRNLCFWLISALVLVYTAVTGFSVSACRAAIMAVVLLFSKTTLKRYDPLCSLALAACVLMCINPYYLYSTGFRFSFLACCGIIMFSDVLKRTGETARKWLSAATLTVSAQLMCLPVQLAAFGTLSPLSPAANMLLVPLATVIIAAAFALSIIALIFPFAAPALQLLYPFVRLLEYGSGIFDSAKAVITLMPMGAAASALYFILLTAASRFIILKNKTKIIICACLCAALTVCIIPAPPQNRVEILAVGNQNCAVITTAEGRHYLVDGGASNILNPKAGNAGYNELTAYMRARGIARLDGAILTHDDIDHSGALLRLVNEGFKVESVYLNPLTVDNERTAEILGINITYITAGDVLKLGESMRLRALYPHSESEDARNISLIFMLEHGVTSMLFTGDIEYAPDIDMKCDIVVLPHHGSTVTFDKRLTDAADADLGIICSADGTADALKNCCGTVLNTAECGQITVLFTADGYKTEVFK